MPGQGALIQRFPLYSPSPSFTVTSLPVSSTSNGCTPGRGNVAHDGLAGVMPARFEIKTPPVSVCHQVSTSGDCFLPICSSYQCQASSLMGSPTVPSTFNEDKSLSFTGSSPNPIKLLIAVGAV